MKPTSPTTTKIAKVEQIMDTFKALVMTKDFEKLTVSEICIAAQVSRKTFYKYFKDKNDIIEQILVQDFLIPMKHLHELYTITELPGGVMIEWVYQRFYNNRSFYEKVSAFTGQNSFYDFILKHYSDIISERLLAIPMPAIEREYMTYFYASSHALLIIKWIKDGMTILPSQIASYYEKWTIPIFSTYYQQKR